MTAEPASLLDLHATFLDYAEVEVEDVDSVSLRPLLTGKTDEDRDAVFAGFRSWRMVFDGQYKLITGWDPEDPGAAIKHYARPYPSVPTTLSECQYVLYDLHRNEHEDISDTYPVVVESLFERLTGNFGN